ncbi:MAG: hypothetical protein IJJ41_04660 [Clostridia bacterium]|nr:hypothetical protein [Clostridia bacterium]MBR0414962.1 hypothetical protein [Clostridia bacterium]
MPNFLCKQCNCINQVAPEATHFTCKNCGVKQETPSFLERVENNDTLDKVMLIEPEGEEKEKPFISTKFTSPDKPEEPMIVQVETDETTRKNNTYFKALSKMGGEDIALYKEALELLRTVRGWKDADDLIVQCEEKIERLLEEEQHAAAAKQKKQKQRKLAVIIGAPLLVFLAIFAVVFGIKIYPDMRYRKAIAFAESGDTVKAYELFTDLNGYKDSREKAKALYETYKTEKLTSAAVGDIVYYGTYEQDGDAENGKEDIAWVVLERAGDRLLLCSRYGLDYQKYSKEKEYTTWESSHMRQWLNNTFLEESFSEEEATHIILTDVSANKNPDYDTPYGDATKDKVFLLSTAQVEQYFPTPEERLIAPTDYAVEQSVYKSKKMYSGINTCCWLLRTPGSEGTQVAYVYYDGTLRYSGASVNTRGASFCPTMWVEIQKEQ